MNTTQPTLPRPRIRLDVQLLALDLNTCNRCTSTAANLRAVLALAADTFAELGVDATLQETIVETADQATQLRFASSPTVRFNGRDIAAESRESSCDDCTELCGCGDGTSCRVWVWQGVEHLAAPKALILDALLKEYVRSADTNDDAPSVPFHLPENLQSFFSGRVKRADEDPSCCDRSICCDSADKSACCGNDVESSACGCQ